MITCAIFRLFPWCLQPQIPRETNISLCRCPASCKTSVMSLWISAMLDNLAMDPPAISCHEDQFPHVVEQINTTKKWHFFHLTNATIGHQCLGFHTLRTWPKSFPQLRWVQWFLVYPWQNMKSSSEIMTNMFFRKLYVKNPEVMMALLVLVLQILP